MGFVHIINCCGLPNYLISAET